MGGPRETREAPSPSPKPPTLRMWRVQRPAGRACPHPTPPAYAKKDTETRHKGLNNINSTEKQKQHSVPAIAIALYSKGELEWFANKDEMSAFIRSDSIRSDSLIESRGNHKRTMNGDEHAYSKDRHSQKRNGRNASY